MTNHETNLACMPTTSLARGRLVFREGRTTPKMYLGYFQKRKCQHIWKTQQWPQDWKRSVFIPIPKKGNATECSNNRTIELISHTSKVMLKIFQARLQQYVKRELPDVQAGFRKGKETRDKLPTSTGLSKKQESSRKKNLFSALLTMPKALTLWITTNCRKF